ncbi:tRNA modification GTPase [Candidatus Tremblaya phenacola]|uniref:tRNA modification GTPase MnmE n=1 Tax=Candidatus Tremblayella phenacoccinincola TaxID=1010676 RepID=A0A2G0V6N9_9PROT|nr:GTPase [Candidatus Tremblaya phenacola]PHN16169.1 tRNA modification GTPase MnmE [Candidatus Tremblaya phenacola]
MNANIKEETIAALSTTQKASGIGIIKISGIKAKPLAISMLGKLPEPRKAELLLFYNTDKVIIDKGIAIYFPKPCSFTGEDVLELQGHGNPILLDSILQRLVNSTGVRLANPGEFLKRAYLNRKIDLTQAEAISTLIAATSLRTASCAMNSMLGIFSDEANNIKDLITKARINIEASLCFIETPNRIPIRKAIKLINKALLESKKIYIKTKLYNNFHKPNTIVITGAPNTGKSSIFNTLTESDTSIVTDLSGTTRDTLAKPICISGMSLTIVDTAGIHKTKDILEKISIKRTWGEVIKADHILLIKTTLSKDNRIPNNIIRNFSGKSITIIINKIDLTKEKASIKTISNNYSIVKVSAKTGEGLAVLKDHLKRILDPNVNIEPSYICRKRYLCLLKNTIKHLIKASKEHIRTKGVLIADAVGLAEKEASKLVGESSSEGFLTEQVLNELFDGLCIGK